jgi:hypothetical protein
MFNFSPKNNLVILADTSCKHSLVYLQDMIKNKLSVRAVFALNFKYILPNSPKKYVQILRNLTNRKIYIRLYYETKILRLCKKNSIECINLQLESFKDDKLELYLYKFNNCAFLYTCGGIVPKSLLSKYKFLHVHLGWVPLFKGSDCLLYSIMYRQKITASLIYMSSKIDTGDVIARMRMPLFDFRKYDLNIRLRSSKRQYRYITSNIDPIIRSKFLIEFIKNAGVKDFRRIKSSKQEIENTSNFLWIHPSLYEMSLNIWKSNLPSRPFNFDQSMNHMEIYLK